MSNSSINFGPQLTPKVLQFQLKVVPNDPYILAGASPIKYSGPSDLGFTGIATGVQSFFASFGSNVDHNLKTIGVALGYDFSSSDIVVKGHLELLDNNGHDISQNGSSLTAGVEVLSP